MPLWFVAPKFHHQLDFPQLLSLPEGFWSSKEQRSTSLSIWLTDCGGSYLVHLVTTDCGGWPINQLVHLVTTGCGGWPINQLVHLVTTDCGLSTSLSIWLRIAEAGLSTSLSIWLRLLRRLAYQPACPSGYGLRAGLSTSLSIGYD